LWRKEGHVQRFWRVGHRFGHRAGPRSIGARNGNGSGG
jgi:hypothetical protein